MLSKVAAEVWAELRRDLVFRWAMDRPASDDEAVYFRNVAAGPARYIRFED